MDSDLINTLLFSIAAMFIVIPLQTGMIIQIVIVSSINDDYKVAWDGYEWSGYIGSAIASIVAAILSWFVPSLIIMVGCRWALAIGGIAYCLSYSIFIYPFKYGLIFSSLVLGFANAVVWPAQSNYLAVISNEKTISRNTGILWIFTYLSMVLGNLVIFYAFKGKEKISSTIRQLTFLILVALGLFGVFLLAFLKKPRKDQSKMKNNESPWNGFSKAFKLMATKKMILISILGLFTGLEMTFFTGLYSTSVTSTIAFGVNRKKYSCECGILIGIGEMCAGLVLILSSKCKRSEFIVLTGYLLYILTFACILVNLPFNSSLYETAEPAIFESSLYLALLCALTLGLCDGIYSSLVTEFISIAYKEDSSAPFAIFSSLQCIAGALLFYLSNYIGLHVHLFILTTGATIGTLAFWMMKRLADKEKWSKLKQIPGVILN